MSYTAVPTVTTGDLWTASNHNTYVKDNFASGVPDIFTAAGQLPYATAADAAAPLAIGSGSGNTSQLLGITSGLPAWRYPIPRPLYALATPVSVTNTTAETTLFTTTITGGTLGLTNVLLGAVLLTQLNNVTTNPTITFRLKYGATTILTDTDAGWGVATATLHTLAFHFWLANNGATNAQILGGWYIPSGGTPSQIPEGSTAGEDSTADKALALTVQHPTANTSYITKLYSVLIELNRDS